MLAANFVAKLSKHFVGRLAIKLHNITHLVIFDSLFCSPSLVSLCVTHKLTLLKSVHSSESPIP